MNKKRFISALLVVVMVFTSLHLDSIDVKAMTEADNSIVYSYNDTDKTATVTGYNDDSSNPVTSIVIPETVTKDNVSYTVSSIESGALTQDKCSALKEVAVLGDKVEIQKDAFGKAVVDGETTGGFVVWCNAGSTAETYGNSIGATVKYLNVKDIEIQQPVKTYFSGCEPFTITTTIAAKDSATATEDILFTIPKESMKYIYFVGNDGNPTNTTTGTITQNSDGTAKVEAMVQVCTTENMDVQDAEVTITASSRGTGENATNTYNIYKATSTISQEIRVFKVIREYDEAKKQYITQAVESGEGVLIKVEEVPLEELESNGYFSNNTLYVDKDYIFAIKGLTDNVSAYDSIGSTWNISTQKAVESLVGKTFNFTSVSDKQLEAYGIADTNGNEIVDVDARLLKYANSVGTTYTRLFSKNNTLSKNINVQVCQPAESLKMKLNGAEVEYGSYISGLVQTSYQLSHEFTPTNSTDTVVWSSDNPGVASVNDGTSLYLNTAGDATITCTVKDSKSGKRNLAGWFKIKSLAKYQYKEIVFAKDDNKNETITKCDIPVNGEYKIIVCDARDGVIYTPADSETAANEPCTFKSSNESVAKVDEYGTITAGAKAGTAKITVISESGVSNILEVNVYAPVTDIVANTIFTVPMGQTRELSYSFKPATATEDVVWSSENNSICVAEDYVNDNGERSVKISGLKEGKAMLTGKTVQSGATVRINVEVAKPINTDKISLNSDLNDVTTDEEGNTVYNVAKGNSFYVKPVITSNDPENPTPNDLTKWTIEAGQDVCNVSSDGGNTVTFTAKKTGKIKATFTAYGKTPAGDEFEKNVSFYINVYVPATSVDIKANNASADVVNVELGNTAQISAILTPSDSTDSISWTQDNDNVELSVDKTASGVSTILTGKKVGTTTLTATSDSGKVDTIKVNVIIKAEKISFYQHGQEATKAYVPLKGTADISLSVSNDDVTTDKTFTWSTTGNSTYINIKPSEDGKSAVIEGLAKGTQKITVTAPSGATASIDVEVVVPAESIELNNTEFSIFKGDSPINVFANISPAETTDVVTWSVDKEGIIKITEDKANTTTTKKSITVQGVEVGEVKLTATTVDGLTASMKITVTARDIVDTTISDIPDQTYSGREITPGFNVVSGNKSLRLNTDYTVRYTDNINAGTATVTVEGIGIYAGTMTTTFKINPKQISQTQNQAVTAVKYNGQAQTPELALTDSASGTAVTLVEGKDYTVEYLNNTNVGNGIIKFTGMGNYTGEKSVNFQITAKDISTAEDVVIEDIPSVTYNGTGQIPDVVVKDGDKVLELNKDYIVAAADNVNAGTATVTITGRGNYTGILKSQFTINRKSLSKAKLPVFNNQTYCGKAFTITGMTVVVDNRTLSMNNDFKVTCTNNKYPGKATVKIIGIGNYKSSATTSYIILPAAPTQPKISSNTSSSVKLSWKKSVKATGYYIYKYDQKKNKYVKAASTRKNSVTISKLASGTNTTFQIYSYVKVGSKVYRSAQYATIVAGTKTKTPSIKKVKSQVSKSAIIEWKTVTGAEGYEIYYSTSKNGKYKLFGKVNGVSSNVTGLKAKKKYYFKIRTYRTINGKVYYSSYSSVKSAKIKK